LDKLEDILGRRPNLLQVIGGGSKNEFLCQLAANACNLLVTSGPVEATITGNIIMQMIAVGDLKSMIEGKLLINRSFPIKRFEPQHSTEWDAHYDFFLANNLLTKIR
jgi:rhamnulokinase